MFEKIFGYGVSIRNLKGYEKNILVSQELESIGFNESDSIVDIVRSDDANRPKLEQLIELLGNKDRIDLYSVDTLLQGDSNNGIEYYSRIIKKGIGLCIYDFTGSIYKLSEYSNLKFNNKGRFVFKETPSEELIAAFKKYAENKKKVMKSGTFKKKRGIITEAFKEIYFAYESYQIDLPTALSLAKDYCDIGHKTTFWALSADYERSTEYNFDFELYSNLDKNILELPKRSGSIPDEYHQIKNKITASDSTLKYIDKFYAATNELGFFLSYDVFHRWELAYEKKPKPRKPIVTTFNIEKFKEKYPLCSG